MRIYEIASITMLKELDSGETGRRVYFYLRDDNYLCVIAVTEGAAEYLKYNESGGLQNVKWSQLDENEIEENLGEATVDVAEHMKNDPGDDAIYQVVNDLMNRVRSLPPLNIDSVAQNRDIWAYNDSESAMVIDSSTIRNLLLSK